MKLFKTLSDGSKIGDTYSKDLLSLLFYSLRKNLPDSSNLKAALDPKTYGLGLFECCLTWLIYFGLILGICFGVFIFLYNIDILP